MIAYQYVCIQLAAKSGWQLFKELKVSFPIIVIAENPSALDYRDSWHDIGFQENELGVFSPRNIYITDFIQLGRVEDWRGIS